MCIAVAAAGTQARRWEQVLQNDAAEALRTKGFQARHLKYQYERLRAKQIPHLKPDGRQWQIVDRDLARICAAPNGPNPQQMSIMFVTRNRSLPPGERVLAAQSGAA